MSKLAVHEAGVERAAYDADAVAKLHHITVEAKAGSSRREFIRYVEIALREARETAYWLRICVVLRLGPDEELRRLVGEASQICRILGSIVVKTKTSQPR